VPSPHLQWTEGGVRQQVWVTAEGRPLRLLLEGDARSEKLAVEWEWNGAGGLVAVRVEAPERGAELTVRYVSAENVQNPPEVFRLTLPPDIPVRRLD
jgi:hypothetical protein